METFTQTAQRADTVGHGDSTTGLCVGALEVVNNSRDNGGGGGGDRNIATDTPQEATDEAPDRGIVCEQSVPEHGIVNSVESLAASQRSSHLKGHNLVAACNTSTSGNYEFAEIQVKNGELSIIEVKNSELSDIKANDSEKKKSMDDLSDEDDDGSVDSDDDNALVVSMDLTAEVIEPSSTSMNTVSMSEVKKQSASTCASQTPCDDDSGKQELAFQVLSEVNSRKVAAGTGLGASLRSLPIHCVIELASADVGDGQENVVVLDTYAILPGATLFSELVKTSLLRLGYSPGQTTGAKGGIQLKNWKTLMFEAVTDNVEATVEEILGEITSVVTLRICLSRIKTDADPTRDRLLQLLLTKSIDFLVQAGCPVEKSLLEAISTGEAIQNVSDQVCTSFNDWYMSQKIGHSLHDSVVTYSKLVKSNNTPISTPSSTSSSTKPTPDLPAALTGSLSTVTTTQPAESDLRVQSTTSSSYQTQLLPSFPLNLDIKQEAPTVPPESPTKSATDLQDHCHQFSLSHKEPVSLHRNKKFIERPSEKACLQSELFKFSRSPSDGHIPSTLHNQTSNPYLGLMPGKTRIRTSFDPEQEIPRLQKWFNSNQHPTREQMMRFMHELNALESRKGRRPLDLTNIIYWFKNARAAQRRATRALDDSFENEENVDLNSLESGNSTNDSVPPFLPNKNAVYMIPFHPYSHLVAGSGPVDRSKSIPEGPGVDEPYDLSLTKRTTLEQPKTQIGKEPEETHFLSLSTSSSSPTKSSSVSPECESQENVLTKKTSYCPPRFPALLDVASKMRQEIPLNSEDVLISNNIAQRNGCRGSPYKVNVLEHSNKNINVNSHFANSPTPVENGDCGADKFSAGLKIKQENNSFLNCHNSRKSYQLSSRESALELGQVQDENGKMDSSNDDDDEDDDDDDDNTNCSYNSEEELKLRLKQNAAAAAVVDYASAMHSNVSRLTAANMAALSLAQMGQPLHIPQLASTLAMAYYPMDPRFYSQPTVQHSLTSTSPTSLSNTHSSHLSLRQAHDCTPRLESRSPLSSPSVMQQPLPHINHHHHHHHQQQQSSPQQHHRHNSEPRKRRTRVFIDPLTEIPKLENWFMEDTHPSAFMIDKFCEELNKCEYRHKFPKLEPKNIQLWFKNHRAKVKRLKVSCDEQIDQNGASGLVEDMEDIESA